MSSPESRDLPEANGKIAPAYWDEPIGDWRPPRGAGGATYVHITNLPAIREFKNLSVHVGTSPVSIANGHKKKLVLRVVGDGPVYLGSDSNVSVDNGFPILPGETFILEGDFTLYAIATISQQLKILELN
ncbi:hypothetical protein [Halalkalibacter krulwichiae]|uniref:Uncharacterized protein n=1 Tax=Halalkalibacter krulwichiae TaxID=199441 RepID=A0A1X9M9F5_9BACI|nr:hypothetical protein [Halalkalibacter krulwichiae]ARK28803.1 hypothetical protein BkAM31D_02465 [Halalkalibacter krulwichiae]